MEIDYESYLKKGMSYQEFINRTPKNRDRLNNVYSRVTIPEKLSEKIESIHCKFTLLVFAENWCSDTVLTLPILVKLSELTDNIELIIVPRDEILDDFQKYFATDGKAKIPLIIFLIDRSDEIKRWIERTMFADEKVKKLKQEEMSKSEFYKKVITFYMDKDTIEKTTEILACELISADKVSCSEIKELIECEI